VQGWIEDEGYIMVSFAMCSDKEYEQMLSMNISLFLNIIINGIKDILQGKEEIKIEQLIKYGHFLKTQENLAGRYDII